jgi:four helix bundle protein
LATPLSEDQFLSYRDLKVWQEAMSLAVACYELTRTCPKEEMYGMTSQIRRASASVAANIAEGHGRGTTAAFVHFLRTAQGSLKELETHLTLATRVELTSLDRVEALLAQCDGIGRMLRALMRSLQQRIEREGRA